MDGYVALYCRISKDKRGRLEGVRAQEKWGRAYAAQQWPDRPVRVFADNDISAANGDYRPGFEALREEVRGGEVAALWVVEQSRLDRQYEWFPLSVELDAAGITELHTNRDGILQVLDEVAGIKAVLNAAEVRKMKRRLMDTLAEKAALGLPPGSRPFGYVHGKNERGVKTLHIVPAQAEAIRDAARFILDGWSQESVAAEMRKRGLHGAHLVKVKDADGNVVTVDGTPVDEGGVPVTRSTEIRGRTVASWFNLTVAGRRVHQDLDVGPGNWEPILDVRTVRDVKARLASSRVVRRTPGPEGREGPETYTVTPTTRTTGRRYLLTSGTSVCGVCGAPLNAAKKQFTRKLKDGTRKLWKVAPYYSCHRRTGGKACVGIMGDQFEAHVVEQLFAELEKPAFLEAVAADESAALRDELDAALQDNAQQRVELAKLWGLPLRDPNRPTTDEWQAARSSIADEERRLRRELDEVPPAMTRVDPGAIREDWAAMTLDEKRDIISTYINRVTVKRAKRGTNGFDEGRVDIEWR